MESRSRTKNGAGRLRSLNEPRPLAVQADADGTPRAVGNEPVTSIEETWRIDEGWWREAPLSRRYCRVTVENGRGLTLFHDLLTERWYEQRY